MPEWSPYNFGFNNPLRFVDPSGLAPDDWVRDKDGKVTWRENVNAPEDVDPHSGESYLGKSGVGFDESSGNTLFYNPDGSVDQGIRSMPEFTVTGAATSHGKVMGNPVVQDIYATNRAFMDHDITQGAFFAGGLLTGGSEALIMARLGNLGKNIITAGKFYKPAARSSKNLINVAEGGIPRVQNAANRINKPIHLVGSRASGTAKATSDFDYVIKGINSRQWSKIKNSLPGAPSRIDNLPRRIDLFRGPLDPTKPHITIYPR